MKDTLSTMLEIDLPESIPDTTNSQGSDRFLRYLLDKDRIVVFSPHLDDAVLSAGSLISYLTQQKKNVEIVTAFTEGSHVSSAAIERILKTAKFTDIDVYFEERRKEDIRAISALQVPKVTHLGFTDAAWRKIDDTTPLYPATQLGTIDPRDQKTHEQLVEKFRAVLGATDNVAVLAPIGRGKHVDHQITRNVAFAAFPQTVFFQDFPYSAVHKNEDEFIQNNNLQSVEWQGDYTAKRNAILQYATQLNSLSLFFKGAMKLSYETYFLPASLR